MSSQKRTARLAGFLYLLVVVSGPFVLLYVPGKLFVRGNPAASVQNILAHQTLFRTWVAVGIVSELLFIAVALVLYRLLEGVNRTYAAVMALLVLIQAPLAFLGEAFHVATLAFARGAALLDVFDKPQREALAALFFWVDAEGSLVSEVFWGLWLLPLAILVYRSRFLPRFLGVWLFVNGLAYVVHSFTALYFPEQKDAVFQYCLPATFGEVALMLWLLVAGVKAPREELRASTAAVA